MIKPKCLSGNLVTVRHLVTVRLYSEQNKYKTPANYWAALKVFNVYTSQKQVVGRFLMQHELLVSF